MRSKAQFGVELFPSDMIEGGSGQPFLDFFRGDKEGEVLVGKLVEAFVEDCESYELESLMHII